MDFDFDIDIDDYDSNYCESSLDYYCDEEYCCLPEFKFQCPYKKKGVVLNE